MKQGSGNWQLYYICRDYLGSVTHLASSTGSLTQELSFDACCVKLWFCEVNETRPLAEPIPISVAIREGRLRNPVTQTAYDPGSEPALFLGRGYTGHEHLPEFGLINMNGRLYDPAVGRFLSPDNNVQMPDNTQNFNRYSYCLNNPLKYTDPSGELFWIFPTIGWSKEGGLSIGLSAGFGIPGSVLSVQAGANYSFKSNDFSIYRGVSALGNTFYWSLSNQSGLNVGYSFGLSPYSGVPISSNFLSAGVNYNINHNSWSGNLSAWQVDQSGWAFNPSVSAMVFPEQTTNLVRGQGFRSNNAVLSRFDAAGDYQGALDYFGFKGTYDPNSNYAGYVNASGEIVFGKLAFEKNFDYLHYAASEELFHQRDMRTGSYDNIDWNDKYSFETIMARNQGEYKAKNYQYRNQGLFRKAYGVNTLNRIIKDINSYGGQLGYPIFTKKSWHSIYKIPRLW